MAVSTLDIPAAVAEVERSAGDGRFAQILLPVRNDVPYGNRLYHPLYEAAQRHGLPIALHAWGRGGNAPTHDRRHDDVPRGLRVATPTSPRRR